MNESEKENIKEQILSPSQTYTVLKQASFISNNEPNISTFHTFRCIKKRMPWTEEEDKIMKQLINKYGTSNWSLISSKMGKSRNGKQCRERWYNHLNPSLKKNNWTLEEENILFSKHMQLGNKWSDIADFLPGRTLNDIKNHFYSKLRKFIRKILKQINDEKLFQINGIDSCKYTGEKIYKMIKKHDTTLKNLTKDTIFELIIATEKNPKGKFIFFNENNENVINEYINNESNLGIIKSNTSNNFNNNNFSNNFFLDESYENYNYNYNNNKNNINQNNGIINDYSNNYINLNLTNNNLCNYSFKLKLRKYSNLSDNKSEKNTLNNNNNIKVVQNNKKKKTKEKKQKTEKESKEINNKPENNENNKLLGIKRKKSNKKNPKNKIPELILPENQKSIKKRKKASKNKNTLQNQTQELSNLDNLSRNSFKDMKYLSGTETNNNFKNINYNFYPPFNLLSPKEHKNIYFPLSMTKSNKSIKQEDFSFSNKLNSINDYLEPSLQKGQIFPLNNDNYLFLQQKKNNYLMSDLSCDNNLLNLSCKNDNTYRNFSINGNYYNKIPTQNNMSINNNLTIKSLNEKNENKKENDKPVIINIDLINHQDFTNAFINGNTSEGNERSQYNYSIYNKNNNNLNIFNPSSPPSVKSYCWK